MRIRKGGANLFLFSETKILKGNVVKRENMSLVNISNAVLASRYLALQELREKVRRAEDRFASGRLKKAVILQGNSGSHTEMIAKNRRS
jgi:hypothetical protein